MICSRRAHLGPAHLEALLDHELGIQVCVSGLDQNPVTRHLVHFESHLPRLMEGDMQEFGETGGRVGRVRNSAVR